jgi:DNA-binding transcriptional LysR family regulator
MRISLEALESFAILCRVKSYSKTAKELGRSQPAISNRIRSLEALVGFDLFENGDASLTLTDNGRELLDCSQEILRNVHRIRSICDPARIQPVQISFVSTVESFLNPYKIFNSGTEGGLSSLFIELLNSEDIESKIRSLKGNIAYTVVQEDNAPLLKKSWPFTMRWISHKGFSLKENMKGFQLPIVELSDNARFSKVFYSKLESLGVEYKPVFRADGISTYLNAISAGVGIGCIGDLFVVHKMKSRNLSFLDAQIGNLGTFYLSRFNDDGLSADASRAVGIFDKAVSNQKSIRDEYYSTA